MIVVNGVLLGLVAGLVAYLFLRRAREREIRRSEARFRTLFESAPIGILVGRDGIVQDFNPAALRILGLRDRAEAAGTEILRWVGTKSRESASEVIVGRRAGRVVPPEIEVTGRRADGTEIPLAVRVATSVLPEGESGIAFFTDVSDKLRAEEALRTSEEHYRTLIENTSDLIMIVDREGFVRFAGGGIASATGFRADELAGERWLERLDERDRRDLLVWLARHDDAVPAEPFPYRMKHKDGWWRDFEATANHLPRSKDLVVTSRDITLRIELEAQLQHAHRINSLGRLAGTIAHEFNNILMGILPSVELIERDVEPGSAARAPLDRIRRSVVRGGKITREILHFTQPPEPRPRPFGIAEWLRSTQQELDAMLRERIDLRIEIADPDLAASADPAHVHRALLHLASNAIAAMPEGGTLTIAARRPDPGQHYRFGSVPNAWRFVHLEVRDTGAGIAPDVLPHVFEPLFTTSRAGATGLGLPLVHQLVTLAGGKVYVETEPGCGTAFHLFIPAAAARSASLRETSGSSVAS